MPLAAFLLAFSVSQATAQDATPNPLAATLTALGSAPCEIGDLTCVTIPVPRNHFANDPTATIDITFAISRATGPSKGVIIYVIGGPGGSGLAVADDYLSAFDASLVEQMDFVFFDQRGIGPVHGFTCLNAMMALRPRFRRQWRGWSIPVAA